MLPDRLRPGSVEGGNSQAGVLLCAACLLTCGRAAAVADEQAIQLHIIVAPIALQDSMISMGPLVPS